MTASRRVTVVPRLNHTAFKGNPDEPAPPCKVMDLSAALAEDFSGDVYLCGYAPSDRTADKFHRLAKSALAFYALTDEQMPTLDVALIDIDAPGHKPPVTGWADGVLSVVPSDLGAGWYRTPNGMRLVILPAQPIPLLMAASYLDQLAAYLSAAGVPIDPTTDQWSRLFRAPRALRRDLPSDFSSMRPSTWAPPAALVEDAPSALGEIVARADHEYGGATMSKSELAPLYKRDPGLAEALYRTRWQVAPGGRHAAVVRATVTVAEAFETSDPALVFRVLGAQAAAMLSDRPDARAEVIRACEWACALLSGQKEATLREEATLRTVASRAMSTAQSQVKRRLIVDAGSEFFVWDEQRLCYSRGYTHAHQLYGALARHCPTLAGSYTNPDSASTAEVYRDLSTPAQHIVFTYAEDAMNGLDETRDTFYLRSVQQDPDLAPVYRPEVDRWLREIGGPGYDLLLDWLACAPRLDRPVCALYIDAPPSVGKGMLAAGLARLWSAESAITDYKELLRNFNEQLRYSPLVVADEKVPQDAFEANDSSVFRRVVGNGRHTTEAKHRAVATLVGYPRLLITANNDNALGIREDMSPDDLDAVRLRLGYIRREKDECRAADVLAEMATAAGYDFPRDYTDMWVKGGWIAEHVLWLSENRQVRPGRRFLVEGWESTLTRNLATNAGGSAIVATAVARAITHGIEGEAVRWYAGNAYVSANHLASEWVELIGNDHDKCPHDTSRVKALKAMSGGEKKKITHRNARRAGAAQGQYYVIPSEIIAKLAEERGVADASEIVAACARKSEKERPAKAGPSGDEARAPALSEVFQ